MLKDIEEKPQFVIALISSGEEVGREAKPYRVGSLVEVEFTERQGDFIFIRTRGMHRVYLDSFDREAKPYLMAACLRYLDEGPAEIPASRILELEAKILNMVKVLGPEESRGIREVLDDLRFELDSENYSLFLCGCLELPPIYLQRLLESRSQTYRIENALNLLSQRE
jgi:Lon protease-like protein